ncbi:MAG: DNA polymerase III subunit delta [Bacteroidota bacterium]|nr:DNA polymerase III subunit delta [Bacteroidota bacterium]MDP4234013.1 DNA polymerase III subunit delta [Bacteroidota bacterium]MDP4242879.1 DNA polymerase III subunit delta [Bacteroidota bacterium]MDP4287682.1 DNA polymerase III subunit delta [Bacteroidota bacterium]
MQERGQKSGAVENILKAWRAGKPAPVYVFHGEEDFLRSELLHEAPTLLVPDEATRSFNFDQLYASDVSLSDVITMASGYPMMAERRVVIVREAERMLRPKPAGQAATRSSASRGKKKGGEDPLLSYLEHPNQDCVLIFDMEKFGARNQSPFKELAAKAEVVEFAVLKDAEATEWVKARAMTHKKKLGTEAARLMVAQLGIGLGTLASELEKLAIYAGDRDEITSKDVEALTGASRERSIFELTKAIGTANRELAATILLRILRTGKDQRAFVLIMLARHFEQLTLAHELSAKRESEHAIAEALGLHGGAAYFVKETISAARRYSRERLDAAARAIVHAEETSRRGHTNDELLMEMLLLKLMPA